MSVTEASRSPSCSHRVRRLRALLPTPWRMTAPSKNGIVNDLTACIEGHLRPLGIGPELLERFRRVLEAARELRSRGMRFDLNPRDTVAFDIVQLDIAAGGIDDAPAIGSRKARVVLALVGVTAYVASVERARIDVADAFVIGQEIDAIADPHRPAGISVG